MLTLTAAVQLHSQWRVSLECFNVDFDKSSNYRSIKDTAFGIHMVCVSLQNLKNQETWTMLLSGWNSHHFLSAFWNLSFLRRTSFVWSHSFPFPTEVRVEQGMQWNQYSADILRITTTTTTRFIWTVNYLNYKLTENKLKIHTVSCWSPKITKELN